VSGLPQPRTPANRNYRNYAAVAADTFSSELGILSKSTPRLITSLTLRKVPPGTNGGVTPAGLAAGLLGSFTIALTSAVFLPFCADESGIQDRAVWTVAMTFWGLLGSVLDSVLGGLLQASVVDKRSGKVVEGSGGRKVSSLGPACEKVLTRFFYRFSSTRDPPKGRPQEPRQPSSRATLNYVRRRPL
jgi:uncharacterized membrane protein